MVPNGYLFEDFRHYLYVGAIAPLGSDRQPIYSTAFPPPCIHPIESEEESRGT